MTIREMLVYGGTILLVLSAQLVSGFPSGAPPDVCSNDLTPIHGSNQATGGTPPFTLTASSSTYSSNKPITVVLKGLTGRTFMGFAIQALDAHSRTPIQNGEWRGSSSKELPCAAVTHTNSNAKNKVELTWTAKGSGEVVFMATVVESFDIFYTNIKSSSRSSSSSANSFHTRGQKVRPSTSSQENFPTGTLSYDPRPASSHKEDEVSNQDPFSSYYQHYPGFSQPDTGSDDMASESVHFYRNPYQQYPYLHGYNRHGEDRQHDASDAFGNYPSPSVYSHRFAPQPQLQRYPQPYHTPWQQYQPF